MAKIARRSVASNPSSLTSVLNSKLIQKNDSVKIDQQKSSVTPTNAANTPIPSTPDPLRSSGFQLTTRTIPKNFNRHGNASSSGQSASSTSNSNSSKAFDNVNTNSTNSTISQQNFNSTRDAIALQREKDRIEFYATYDVMTGVRIAATLGGFFSLMVFLIVYKSRSHSNETLKVLKDPKIAAVAAACMQEEEDRIIQEAMEATGLSIFPDEYDTMLYRRQRMLSVGNVSAPPVLHRGFRFSSVGGGGYSSLLEPRRYSYSGSRRKSASESSRILSAYPMGSSFGTDDYFVETDDELETEFDHLSTRDETTQQPAFLVVPMAGQESRRSSAMTCCSTESSYLERRCSALTLGLNSLPSTFEEASNKRRSSIENWDYYYPDIQVISATPKTSPCPSERSLEDKPDKQTIPTARSDSTTSSAINDNGYCSPEGHSRVRNGSTTNSTIDGKPVLLHRTDSTKRQNCAKTSADNNELKLVVKRKISDPSSVNNNSYSNVCNNSYKYSVQYRKDDVRRAPLASISSFKISSIDYQDSDLKSLGSDSVFVESYADTDDDMEQFSTDSDELSADGDQPEKEDIKPHHTVRTKHLDERISLKPEFSQTKPTDVLKVGIKRGRPLLQRHRTLSVSSNDRVMLISQQSQEQPLVEEDLQPIKDPELNRISTYPDFVSSPPSLSHRDTVSLPTEETTYTTPTPSTQNTEIQKATTSFTYDNNNDSCSNSSKQNSRENKNSKSKENNSSSGGGNNSSNECVEVNVIIENRPTNVISPSVILELPVIALPSQDDDPPRDPSLPGTSRKWSKETLF